jgi:hypothetical protein
VEVGQVIDFTVVMSPNNHGGIYLQLMMVGLMEETDQMVKRGGLASTLIEPDKIIKFLYVQFHLPLCLSRFFHLYNQSGVAFSFFSFINYFTVGILILVQHGLLAEMFSALAVCKL